MRVPVILLNYNSASDCRKCVSFLKRQQGVELEIIIVDNCSREDDRNDVERLCQKQGCTFIPATKIGGTTPEIISACAMLPKKAINML